MKTIVLIAGHSEKSWGAQSKNGVREYELANSIVSVVRNLVNPCDDIDICLMTSMIVNLKDKIIWANKMRPDLAIEVHFNACSLVDVQGSEAFYYDKELVSKAYALKYCKIYEQVSGVKTRGAKKDSQSQYSRLGWCRDIKCPSILVDNEFMTYRNFNPELVFYYSVCAMLRFLKEIS